MKKFLSMVSIAALALTAGCSEDQTTDLTNLKQDTLRATTEESTRTALDGTKVVWSAGDKIAVLTDDNTAAIEQYTLTSEAGSSMGEFSGTPLTGTGEIYVAYPYVAVTGFAEGEFNFTLPATQTFTTNSFANNAFPMVGKGNSMDKLPLRNLMGVIKFQVGGDQTMSSLAVSSLTVTTTGEKIAGAASVVMDYTDVPELVVSESGTTSITLTDVNTTLTPAPTTFYIALPAGEYAAGLTFELKNNEGTVIWSKTTTKTVTVTRSQVAPLTPVYTKNFPDAQFRKYLVEQKGYVATADGSDIDITNVTNISKFGRTTTLDCQSQRIASLKGIEFFTALTELNCYDNQLTMLDVTKNTALKILYCHNNAQLTSLDVTQNTALTLLGCYDNSLTTLDVTKNTALKTLYCSNNGLTTLDVIKNTALEIFYCNGNQLTTLDVTKNTALKTLYCYDNSLTTLDVTTNTALKTLYCNKNGLTTLDVTKNTALKTLFCYNNRMSALDISKNGELMYLDCGKQTSDGTIAQTLTLWCDAAQLADSSIGTGTDNENVTKALKE